MFFLAYELKYVYWQNIKIIIINKFDEFSQPCKTVKCVTHSKYRLISPSQQKCVMMSVHDTHLQLSAWCSNLENTWMLFSHPKKDQTHTLTDILCANQVHKGLQTQNFHN